MEFLTFRPRAWDGRRGDQGHTTVESLELLASDYEIEQSYESENDCEVHVGSYPTLAC